MHSPTMERESSGRMVGFSDKCSTVQLLLTGRVTHRGEIVLQRCEPKSFVTRGEPTRSRTTEQPTNSKSFECIFNVAGTQGISRCAAENPRTLHLPGCRKFSARSFSIDARGPGTLGATHPRITARTSTGLAKTTCVALCATMSRTLV